MSKRVSKLHEKTEEPIKKMSNAQVFKACYLKLKQDKISSTREKYYLKGKLLGMARCLYFGDEIDHDELENSDDMIYILEKLSIISYLYCKD